MDIYTLDRNFKRQELVDSFTSVIWTERYGGDDELQIVVPTSPAMEDLLKAGTLIEDPESDIPMITEDMKDDGGLSTVTGISLTQWLNNRFVRASAYPGDSAWAAGDELGDISPGHLIATIVQNWAIDSVWLTDPVLGSGNTLPSDLTNVMGMAHPSKFKIPGLTIGAYDNTLPVIAADAATVPYGPLFDVIKQISDAYRLGIKIVLDSVSDSSYSLKFYAYLGLDRRSTQSVNENVRFSPLDNSLSNIKKFKSLKEATTLFFGYAKGVDDDASTYYITPEFVNLTFVNGFDLKAEMVNYDDIDQSMVEDAGGPIDQGLHYGSILTQRLYQEWLRRGGSFTPPSTWHLPILNLVDGELVDTAKYKYGTNYGLGDIIEMEGYDGTITNAMVTEHIRSQDAQGEKSYPTVSIIQ